MMVSRKNSFGSGWWVMGSERTAWEKPTETHFNMGLVSVLMECFTDSRFSILSLEHIFSTDFSAIYLAMTGSPIGLSYLGMSVDWQVIQTFAYYYQCQKTIFALHLQI